MMHPKMTSSMHQLYACPPGSLVGGLTRTRFFDGMFLTQADLENEQVYWRMKRRLTNRALGTGIVWGLKVRIDLETQKITLTPGYALDCCGNDLIVECPLEAVVGDVWQRSLEYLSQPSLGTSTRDVIPVCLVLQYVECPEASRAVHRDACSPIGGGCEPSRVRETTRLLFVPPCRPPTTEPTGDDPSPEDLCEAQQYPGPRCLDTHHGVYLGCGHARRNGQIVDFTMCDTVSRHVCRRHVITGPYLEFIGALPSFLGNNFNTMFSTRGTTAIVERAVTAETSVQPLARAAVRDFIGEVFWRAPLSGVMPNVDAKLATMTVGSFLETEPEAILARLAGDAAPTEAQRATVNKLFAEVESKVQAAAGETARAVARLVASREALAKAENQEALVKAIKLSGVTPDAIKAAAVAASRR